MNSTTNSSFTTTQLTCDLRARVYTPFYLFMKLLNATYLRLLIVPGILLNLLCLFVLSRSRLASKSTTVVFLRFLAIFDIFAIILKYIRAEVNHQSLENGQQIFLLTPSFCRALYVFMNGSISITMWTITLMSLDKAIAVSYPLKSSIWLTLKRAYYIFGVTVVVLFFANLSFIRLSGVHTSKARDDRKYCGLESTHSFVVDLLTASVLPISLTAGANIVIAVVLHRSSRVSLDWRPSDDHDRPPVLKQKLSTASVRFRPSTESAITVNDIIIATKRRTSVQVTRVLLAITSSLIICHIPNTMYFLFTKFYKIRELLSKRPCIYVTDNDIDLYRLSVYFNVIQDILSDLPHIVNFFLYCLAGKKFRTIFFIEIRRVLLKLRLIHRRERRSTQGKSLTGTEITGLTGPQAKQEHLAPLVSPSKGRNSVDVLYNGKTAATVQKALLEDNSNQRLLRSHTFDK